MFRTVAVLTFGFLALLTVAASGLPAEARSAQAGQQAAAPARATLDYEYFKTKVEPIFLKKRPGHARCVSCHGQGTPLRLQPLDPGATTWTEEESRKNFDVMRRVAVPGSLKSKLLMHPLAEDAGGDFFHNGGKHFASQNDPEWQILRNWVMGQTTGTN